MKVEIWRSDGFGTVWPDDYNEIASIDETPALTYVDVPPSGGREYSYRSRRLDTDTGMYSGWSQFTTASGDEVLLVLG